MNLAVKAKIHINVPQIKGTDCQSLLDYYDMFLRLPKYSDIKSGYFEKKPQCFGIMKKKNGADPIIEKFEDVDNNNEKDDETDIRNDN